MDAILLKTKLYIPAARSGLVSRSRLIDQLNQGLSRRLILIAAPAGYGKTTLLCDWVAHCGCAVAWLSLDEGDNDPARFLTYLISAVQTIDANFGRDIVTALQSPQPAALADWLPVLINQLDDISKPFVLVLDDYHLLTAPEIHQTLTFLLDHQPPQLHLAIATRKDPPLPLSRLRARGQLIELRQADLRFTPEETAAFLQHDMGVTISSADVATLANRTEGWIAGLQLAAFSLRDKADVSRLIRAFGGSHEYLVDYFAGEVLAQQPEPLKTFLLQTSILDRMCGDLCEAVTGQTHGQHLLEQLYHTNLFVVPLDTERVWYRYHQLFRELLRKQLQHEAAEQIPELHRRASQWCAAHALIEEAVEHALAAHDEDALGRLLDDHAEALFLRGEHVTLMRWIAALPDAQRQARPALGALQVILLSAAGRNQEAEFILREVDQALTGLDEDSPQQRQLLSRAAAAHTVAATLHDDPQTILFYARRALDLAPDKTSWRSGVLLARSSAHFLLGDLTACIKCLSEAMDIATAWNNSMLRLAVMPRLAHMYWMQGQLNQAGQICQAGLDYIDQRGLARSPLSDNLLITWGAILCERGDLDRSADFIRRGLESSQAGQVILTQHFAYRSMVRVCLAQHDWSAAAEYLRLAEALAPDRNISIQHTSSLIGLKAQLLIQQGRLTEADQVLRAFGDQSGGEIPLTHHGRLYLSQAQLHLVQGDWPAADRTLDRLFRFSQASGQRRWVIPIQILRAKLCLLRQDLPQALAALEMALEQAEPEQFIQDFLDEGESIGPLLHEAIRRNVKPDFARHLLKRQSSDRPVAPPIDLVEPLSDREIEVLKLVAEGLSNQEIATQLYLSLRTIKFHTGNLYSKLGVKSRTEAVAKARALNLLST